MLRVGLVGMGEHMREKLIPAIRTHEEAHIVAVCTRNPSSLAAHSHLLPSAKHFSNLNTFSSDASLDCIIGASTPNVHTDLIKAGYLSNTPVFVEKPSHISPADLPDTLKNSNYAKKVQCGYNLPFAAIPSHYLHAISCSNSIVHSITIRSFSNKPRDRMWGLKCTFSSFLYSVGIHAIDFARRLTGLAEITSINVDTSFNGPDLFSSSITILTGSSQLITFEFTNLSSIFVFEVDTRLANGDFYRMLGTQKIESNAGKSHGYQTKKTTETTSLPKCSIDGYVEEVGSFFSNVRNGKCDFQASLNEDLVTVGIIEQIIRAKNGIEE